MWFIDVMFYYFLLGYFKFIFNVSTKVQIENTVKCFHAEQHWNIRNDKGKICRRKIMTLLKERIAIVKASNDLAF